MNKEEQEDLLVKIEQSVTNIERDIAQLVTMSREAMEFQKSVFQGQKNIVEAKPTIQSNPQPVQSVGVVGHWLNDLKRKEETNE